MLWSQYSVYFLLAVTETMTMQEASPISEYYYYYCFDVLDKIARLVYG